MNDPKPKFPLIKMFQVFIYHILLPVVAMILFSLISRLTTGNWLQLFKMISITGWIIVVVFILMWIIIIVYRKKLIKLESKISKFKTVSKVKPIVRNNAYWFPNKDGTEDGLFCTKCWDDDTKQIRLNPLDPPYSKCPKCKNIYQTGPDIERKHKTSNEIKFLNEP